MAKFYFSAFGIMNFRLKIFRMNSLLLQKMFIVEICVNIFNFISTNTQEEINNFNQSVIATNSSNSNNNNKNKNNLKIMSKNSNKLHSSDENNKKNKKINYEIGDWIDGNKKVSEIKFEDNRAIFLLMSMEDLKKERILKWIYFLHIFSSPLCKYNIKMSKLVSLGIPDCFRGLIWSLVSGAHELLLTNSGLYFDFLKTALKEKNLNLSVGSLSFPTIDKDISRTFPTNPFFSTPTSHGLKKFFFLHFLINKKFNFRQILLKNLLYSFCVANKEISYCQGLFFLFFFFSKLFCLTKGMNFVSGILLMETNQENAFWILIQMMKKYKLEKMYSGSLSLLNQSISVFCDLFSSQFPQFDLFLVIFFIV